MAKKCSIYYMKLPNLLTFFAAKGAIYYHVTYGNGDLFTCDDTINASFSVLTYEDTMGRDPFSKIPTGPTAKRGPPQKVDPFFRNFSGWTEPIH